MNYRWRWRGVNLKLSIYRQLDYIVMSRNPSSVINPNVFRLASIPVAAQVHLPSRRMNTHFVEKSVVFETKNL